MKNKWLMGIIVAAVVIGSGVVILDVAPANRTVWKPRPLLQQTTSAIVAEGRVVRGTGRAEFRREWVLWPRCW